MLTKHRSIDFSLSSPHSVAPGPSPSYPHLPLEFCESLNRFSLPACPAILNVFAISSQVRILCERREEGVSLYVSSQ